MIVTFTTLSGAATVPETVVDDGVNEVLVIVGVVVCPEDPTQNHTGKDSHCPVKVAVTLYAPSLRQGAPPEAQLLDCPVPLHFHSQLCQRFYRLIHPLCFHRAAICLL